MMRTVLITAAVGIALLLVAVPAAQASFVLKPGATKQYRCVGSDVGRYGGCIRRVTDMRGIRLTRLTRSLGCWSHPWTYGESCTMTVFCRLPHCRATNGSKVRLRVWRNR